ncbi:MAG: DNA replication/repair protein RecF [Chitinophagaceae bacterium]
MLQIDSISLFQFRNCLAKKLDFNERIIALCGPNGVGKTNILDAIHYLCFTKSYFGKTDQTNVSFGTQGFRIQGDITSKETIFNAACIFRENGKKEMILDGETYMRFSDHVGKFPIVVVAPDDTELITGTSELRRKYMDMVISQIDSEYLRQLISFNKVLQQRNSLLKQFHETGNFNDSLLSVFDEQLIIPATYIHSKRTELLKDFTNIVLEFYIGIAGNNEGLSICYQSQLHTEDMGRLLKQNRQKDLFAQRTTVGPHKDDLELMMGTQPVKNIASQGQRKSLLFALKLAEYKILKINKNIDPILLLDDVFEKLDEARMHKLLTWACKENAGQVFLTDTHAERLHATLDKLSISFQLHELT